jgi:hypothetical protein
VFHLQFVTIDFIFGIIPSNRYQLGGALSLRGFQVAGTGQRALPSSNVFAKNGTWELNFRWLYVWIFLYFHLCLRRFIRWNNTNAISGNAIRPIVCPNQFSIKYYSRISVCKRGVSWTRFFAGFRDHCTATCVQSFTMERDHSAKSRYFGYLSYYLSVDVEFHCVVWM